MIVSLIQVDYRIINPKSMTMGELYGSFDPISHEWSDGVLANSFREQASATDENRKWLIFDGPVDAIWIENMNTVLDDNKKLCLMSGEIIQMSQKMNLIFEPEDLEVASPATVSRCGMIYMEPHQLGWKPLMESYLSSIPDCVREHNRNKYSALFEDQKELIRSLFNWLVQPCFDFIRHDCKRFVVTSSLHLVHSLLNLYTCLLDEFINEVDGDTVPVSQSTVWLPCLFMFSLVWTLGGTMNGDSRKKFDVFFRTLVSGTDQDHPRPKIIKLAKVTKQNNFRPMCIILFIVYCRITCFPSEG